MAKESKMNSTVNLAIKIAAILIAIGGSLWMLRDHDGRIDAVEDKAHTTEIETVGIKKDIERLDETVGRIETEQKVSFKAILKKLEGLP